MATLGGASLCGLDDKIGSFEVGKAWDALLVDLAPERGNASLWWDPEEDGDWFEGGFEQWVSGSSICARFIEPAKLTMRSVDLFGRRQESRQGLGPGTSGRGDGREGLGSPGRVLE